MDLWIRSQDNGLYQLKIILPPFEDGSLWGKIEGECILLGVYKSKERALKVLDEIQNILKFGLQINNNNQFVGTTTHVYEMPKE